MKKIDRTLAAILVAFLFIRFVLLLGLPYEGLLGYGDIRTYFQLAELPGWPYLHHWAEYPPVFPFLAEILYRLSGASEPVFVYLLVLLLLVTDLANLAIFYRLSADPKTSVVRTGLLAALLCALPYTWWYFDSFVVLFVLLTLWLLQNNKMIFSGISIGLGAVLKLFPLLMLGLALKTLPLRKAIKLTLISISVVIIVYGVLWLASPEFTNASLVSQPSKGSWQTVWALIDGNWRTGNFGPLWERLEPGRAYAPVNNPARVSPLLTLLVLSSIGLWRFFRIKTLSTLSQQAAFLGFIWSLFFLWSPGWSPQWVYYLLPLIILGLPLQTSILFAVTLIFSNLLEWPILLSRGLFWTLPLSVALRTLVIALLAFEFDRHACRANNT